MFGTWIIIGIVLVAWVAYSIKHYSKQKEHHNAQSSPGEHKRGSAIEDLTGE